jgi:hypothetical protein
VQDPGSQCFFIGLHLISGWIMGLFFIFGSWIQGVKVGMQGIPVLFLPDIRPAGYPTNPYRIPGRGLDLISIFLIYYQINL